MNKVIVINCLKNAGVKPIAVWKKKINQGENKSIDTNFKTGSREEWRCISKVAKKNNHWPVYSPNVIFKAKLSKITQRFLANFE